MGMGSATSEFLLLMGPYFYPWASGAWRNLKHHFTAGEIVLSTWAYDSQLRVDAEWSFLIITLRWVEEQGQGTGRV